MSTKPGAPRALWGLTQAAVQMRRDLPLAVLDAALVGGGYLGVLILRFEGAVPSEWWRPFGRFLPVAVLVHLVVNWACGLYGQIWRHAGVKEARRVLLAGLASGSVLGVLYLYGGRKVPLSLVVLGGAITTMLVGGLRFQSRLLAFRNGHDRRTATRVVVVGAGQSGAAIVREMLLRPEHGLAPVAVLDDDPRKQGRSLSGVPIIGGVDDLPAAVTERHAEQALLAIPSADGELVRRVANAADAVGLTLKVLPSVAEMLGGRVSVRDVRDLSIIDLLGRQQVTTDLDAVRAILRGRRVLITGAGGSIGSEIARQVAACQPSALLLLDHDETHLHDAAAVLPVRCVQLLADVRDRGLVDALVARHRPEVVFHAAAHKHVPLLESHPCEAVATNVLGTAHLVEAAARHGVERFVFISTDKAVQPSSVMGASKRLGEQILLSQAPPGRRYCAVRFGNVLGSRGSVIPTFMRQIERGGPVTVTDPRMTRFFMSIEEAVQLVLQAAAFAEGGEVFMLDMGQPVRILDLAERMIRLSGRRVGVDVAVRISGIRPGEKLVEELRSPEETPHPTLHPSIHALNPAILDEVGLAEGLERLAALARRREDAAVAAELFELANRTPTTIRLPDAQAVASHASDGNPLWNRSST